MRRNGAVGFGLFLNLRGVTTVAVSNIFSRRARRDRQGTEIRISTMGN
jgi:hypothetical protein